MEKNNLTQIITSPAVTYITLTVCIVVVLHYLNGVLQENGILPRIN